MNYENERYDFFKKIYSTKKEKLSEVSSTMIETMYAFITDDANNKKTSLNINEIKSEYEYLSMRISDCSCKELLCDYVTLSKQIRNNENFFPLLIKTQCALGIKPNPYFLKLTKKIFHKEIFIPIIGEYYNDRYSQQPTTDIKSYKQKVLCSK